MKKPDNVQQYLRLTKNLLTGRRNNTLNEQAEDELLEQMDQLWWKMTPEEQQKAESTLQKEPFPATKRVANL